MFLRVQTTTSVSLGQGALRTLSPGVGFLLPGWIQENARFACTDNNLLHSLGSNAVLGTARQQSSLGLDRIGQLGYGMGV